MTLDRITTEEVDSLALTGSPAYLNQALRTLRSLLGKAVEWKVIAFAPKIVLMKEAGREQIIDQETEAKGNAERGNRVLPHGILDRFERLPRGILHSLELMVASALDQSGQGLKILAQIGEVVGDLLNIVAERSLSRHFGVFRGHFILLSDNVPDIIYKSIQLPSIPLTQGELADLAAYILTPRESR